MRRFLLSVCAALFALVLPPSAQAQESLDEALRAALSFSNVFYATKEYSAELENVINLVYGRAGVEAKRELLARILKSFDNAYIYECIKEAVLSGSSEAFVRAYDDYHRRPEYKLIQGLEERQISTAEREAYTFKLESEERKAIFLRVLENFNLRKQSVVYFSALIDLVLSFDETTAAGKKLEIQARLKKNLSDFYQSGRWLDQQLDYMAACYHELDTESLSAYEAYLGSKDMEAFYEAMYEGLAKGLLGRGRGV